MALTETGDARRWRIRDGAMDRSAIKVLRLKGDTLDLRTSNCSTSAPEVAGIAASLLASLSWAAHAPLAWGPGKHSYHNIPGAEQGQDLPGSRRRPGQIEEPTLVSFLPPHAGWVCFLPGES